MIKTKTLYRYLSTLFLLITFANSLAKAQNMDETTQSLKGISKVGIVVENLNQLLHAEGVTEENIRMAVWYELNSSGIDIVPMSKIKNVIGEPYLYINVGAEKSKHEDFYAVSISIQFRQNVLLSRNTKQKYFGAATWSTGNIGLLSADKLKEIPNYTKSLVEKFVKDYLLANKSISK